MTFVNFRLFCALLLNYDGWIMEKITNFTTKETRFLSNFYPYKKDGGMYPHRLTIFYGGLKFGCVENAYQAAKTKDEDIRRKISRMSPYEAKAFWEDKQNQKYLADDWMEKRLAVMQSLVEQKFCNHPDLKQMLLNTGDAELEEGNDWGDTFWGICNGEGQNHLGKILMKIRLMCQQLA